MRLSGDILMVRLMGGLGNQMFQYAAGRAAAMRTGRRLWLDCSWFNGQSKRKYELEEFHIQAERVLENGDWRCRWAEDKRLGVWMWRAGKIFPGLWWTKVQEDPAAMKQGGPAVLLPGHGAVVMQGYWQGWRYFADCAQVIRQDFQMRGKAGTEDAKLLQEIQACDSVAVHVRRGDYVSEPATAAHHGTCSMRYYQQAMKIMKQTLKQPRFYVFSDEPDWVEQNWELDGSMKVVRKSDAGGSKGAVEEMRLMRGCRHFVIANSSFSWWGAWLGEDGAEREQKKMVIVPERWFADGRAMGDGFCPGSWTVLDESGKTGMVGRHAA